MPTLHEVWKQLTHMNDRLGPIEARVAMLTESVDRMAAKLEQLEEKHHKLDTDHQVSMSKMTVVFGVFIFLATTVAGLVIKSGYDGLRAAIIQQQHDKR